MEKLREMAEWLKAIQKEQSSVTITHMRKLTNAFNFRSRENANLPSMDRLHPYVHPTPTHKHIVKNKVDLKDVKMEAGLGRKQKAISMSSRRKEQCNKNKHEKRHVWAWNVIRKHSER